MDRKKVFISYSYDSKKHEDWVLNFTNKLRSESGIEADIDKFIIQEKTTNLPQMMVNAFKNYDFVIIILTENYAKKVDNNQGGVGFEGFLGLQLIMENPDKIIFVKPEQSDFSTVAPFQFKNFYIIDLSKPNKYEELENRIYGKSNVTKSKVGEIPSKFSGTGKDINSQLIYNSLRTAGYELSNISISNLTSPGLIIWPVVPRKVVNVIHRGQIEIIRILSVLLGWKLKIILSTCGSSLSTPPTKTDMKFKKTLENRLKSRNIRNYNFVFLNEYFSQDYEYKGEILNKFIDISSSLTMKELTLFNSKGNGYSKEKSDEIIKRTTLKFIQPVLTWSATAQETELFEKENGKHKSIVIAGQDESTQWKHVFREINSNIGAIFNPILRIQGKDGEEYNLYQEEKKPMWFSEIELIKDLDNGNIAEWLFKSFVYLPNLPEITKHLDYCSTKCPQKEDCLHCLFPNTKTIGLQPFINKEKFIDAFWEFVRPTD